MKLIALLLGLILEKFSTQLFGLREQRWLDKYFDYTLRLMGENAGLRPYVVAIVALLILIAPIALINYWLVQTDNSTLMLALSVLVLFISLGPRDLQAEVDEFTESVERDDLDSTLRVAKELLEFDAPEQVEELGGAVASAIFVQSINRTFAVVLWFVLLGPVGAWAFRAADLLRRRASFENNRQQGQGFEQRAYLQPLRRVHGLLAWLPSRFAAMSFALAGSFEPATLAWKAYYNQCADEFFEVNNDVVGCAGCGALGRQAQDDMRANPGVGALAAMGLVKRSMVVWLVIIALLTLAGASI